MDLGAILAERVFDPLYQRRWGLYDPALDHTLAKSQYESPDEILDQQLGKLRELVSFVQANNSFYGQQFRGVDPERLRGPEDFAKLPLLTKDDLRNRPTDLITNGFERERMFHKRTGGSTGVPVHLWWDGPSHLYKRAIVERHDLWTGYRIGRRRAALWGDTDKHYSLKERLYKVLCERTLYLDTLKMDGPAMHRFVEALRRFRPDYLMGHAHSIYFLVRHLVDAGADDVSFKGIISTAETLSPAERVAIEDRFGEVLFDRYGCEEVSLIASECEAHQGMHTSAEGLYVEVLGGDATTPGRVVVTDLVSRGMPIIRYEVGDLATVAAGRCGCGRGLPRLARVYGRSSDLLYAPDGRQISGISILDTFVIHVPGLRQAQIVQDRLDHVHLRIVRDHGFDESSVEALESSVLEVFGPLMQHDIEYVEEIEPTPRGKFQFTICEIDPPEGSRP